MDEGYGNEFRNNLVIWCRFPGTYNRLDKLNLDVYAGLEVWHDPEVKMTNNVVAGIYFILSWIFVS